MAMDFAATATKLSNAAKRRGVIAPAVELEKVVAFRNIQLTPKQEVREDLLMSVIDDWENHNPLDGFSME